MAAKNSPFSSKMQTLATLLYRYRVISGGSWRSHHGLPPCKSGYGDQGLTFICSTSNASSQFNMGMVKEQNEPVRPPLPASSKSGFYNWAKWLLGSVLTLLLPFWKNNWNNVLKLEGEVEKVMIEVEVVAEVVEKVATTADEALMEVAKQLPDNTKLKQAAQAMEHVTSVAAHDAQLIENVIHKVGDVKQDLGELETMVEPIFDKIIRKEHPKH